MCGVHLETGGGRNLLWEGKHSRQSSNSGPSPPTHSLKLLPQPDASQQTNMLQKSTGSHKFAGITLDSCLFFFLYYHTYTFYQVLQRETLTKTAALPAFVRIIFHCEIGFLSNNGSYFEYGLKHKVMVWGSLRNFGWVSHVDQAIQCLPDTIVSVQRKGKKSDMCSGWVVCVSIFNIWRNLQPDFFNGRIKCCPAAVSNCSILSTLSPHLSSGLWTTAILSGVRCSLEVVLICISLMEKDIGPL